MTDPGLIITYPGYGIVFPPAPNYLTQNIVSLLSTITVGPPTSTAGGIPGILTILTDGTPANNIYQNLNVSSSGIISNYNTSLASFINTNSNVIKNANYLNSTFIAYDNSSATIYNNAFSNLEVVYGYLGIVAGTFTNADGLASIQPVIGSIPSSVSTNPISINDFPNLREVVGDLVIVTDYLTSIPTFPNLKRCNSITIYLNNSVNAQTMFISSQHFPALEYVQRFIRIFGLTQCTQIVGFDSLIGVGGFYDPIAYPVNVANLVTSMANYSDYTTTYYNNTIFDSNGIYIYGNGGVGIGLGSLVGFSSLDVVNGHIIIANNTFQVASPNNFIYGFNILRYCQGIFIGLSGFPNHNLHQIIGFTGLQVVGFIYILDDITPLLYRIVGFKNLRNINYDLTIGNGVNPTSKLTYIDGFSLLETVDTVTIYANKTLAILALSHINSVANSTTIVTYA